MSGNLSFVEGCGIRIDGKDVLVREIENRIRLGSIGGDLLLGSDDTPKIRLFSGLSDIDGDCQLVSPYLRRQPFYGFALLGVFLLGLCR